MRTTRSRPPPPLAPLLPLLLLLLATTTTASSATSRKLAGGNSASDKKHDDNANPPPAPTTTTYSPSHTLTVTKRATVSIADYARDPNDGPWRPDELSSAASSARTVGRRRRRNAEEEANGRRGRTPHPPASSPSDAELLASIPPSVREAAVAAAALANNDDDDDDNTHNDDDDNSALPAHPPKQQPPKTKKGRGPKAKRVRGFDAIDAFEATYALDSGGSISFEPPDSAVAVGNGLVGVAVNSVLTFYRASDGAPLSAPIPARDLLAVGFPAKDPYLLDPSLSYDPEVGRWFYSVARLETNERGALTGGSSIEMAVSGGADPFFEADGGGWSVYSIPSTNTGGGGDDSGCTLPIPACVEAGSCISDYGQMRVSGDGFWLAANVVLFMVEDGDEGAFIGSSVYALSKHSLAQGLDAISVAQWYLDSLPQDGGEPAYTLMPALVGDPWSVAGGGGGGSGGGGGGGGGGGKQHANTNAKNNAAAHFMSTPYSRARDYLLHYLVTGATALHDPNVSTETLQEALRLRVSRVAVPNPWPLPPLEGRDVMQPQTRDFPLGQSEGEPAPGKIGGPDTKIMGLALAQGRLVAVYQVLMPQQEFETRKQKHANNNNNNNNNSNAPPLRLLIAAAWAQIDVGGGGHGGGQHGKHNEQSPKTEAFGTIVDAKGADVVYPNIALAANGKGGISVILSGLKTKPSAAVVPFTLARGAGALRVSGAGKGLQDGDSQYTGRPRFGDYSGSAVEFGRWGGDGSGGDEDEDDKKKKNKKAAAAAAAVWFSSEYIAQSCTLAEYEGEEGADDDDDDVVDPCPLYTCGCSRAPLANYGTRVTRLEVA